MRLGLAFGGTAVIFSLLVVSIVLAWVTHVVVCLKAGALAFLFVGTLFAPIGVIHGYMTWFGYSIVIYAY
jgi:hypothetical protein